MSFFGSFNSKSLDVHEKYFFKYKKMVDIACGKNHQIGLSKEGDIYTWGSNYHYQLGYGDNNLNPSTPIKIFTINNLN